MDLTDAEPQPLLDRMLAGAKRDRQTVTPDGHSVRKLIDGVSIHDIRTQMDERGTLFEAWDPRWGWHAEPMVSAHCFTIRPGAVKGWVLHQTYDDRTLVLLGDMKLVLFDPRPGSATLGQVDEIFLARASPWSPTSTPATSVASISRWSVAFSRGWWSRSTAPTVEPALSSSVGFPASAGLT